MFIPLVPAFQHSGVYGALPVVWAGRSAVAGEGYFNKAPVGSVYYRKVADGHLQTWTKIAYNGRADDWVGQGVITQRIAAVSEFTDGGSTAGTLVLDEQIPDKAYFEKTLLRNLTVTGASITTLVIIVGDGTDTDRYNTGTPSIAADADIIVMGAPSGTREHVDAKSVTLTVTEGSDFGDVTTLSFTIQLFYTLSN